MSYQARKRHEDTFNKCLYVKKPACKDCSIWNDSNYIAFWNLGFKCWFFSLIHSPRSFHCRSYLKTVMGSITSSQLLPECFRLDWVHRHIKLRGLLSNKRQSSLFLDNLHDISCSSKQCPNSNKSLLEELKMWSAPPVLGPHIVWMTSSSWSWWQVGGY